VSFGCLQGEEQIEKGDAGQVDMLYLGCTFPCSLRIKDSGSVGSSSLDCQGGRHLPQACHEQYQELLLRPHCSWPGSGPH
jgi:hypothetical protein